MLYLLLERDLGYHISEILFLAGLYSIFALVLEVPTGILSDSIGARKSLYIGLGLLSLSFPILLLLWNGIGLHLFYVFSFSSAAFFSGAEQGAIRSILGGNDQLKFRKTIYLIQSRMYLWTIPMLLLGLGLYAADPKLLLLVQSLTVFLALLVLSQIPFEATVESDQKKRYRHLASALKDKIWCKRFWGVVLLASAFSSAVLINHRTIQQQLAPLYPENDLAVIGASFAVGNVVSWWASNHVSKMFQKYNPQPLRIFLYLLVFIVAMYLSLSISFQWSAFFVFLGVSFFKAAYRPAIQSELVRQVWPKSTTASSLSLYALLVALLVGFVQMLLGASFVNQTQSNIMSAAAIMTLGGSGLLLIWASSSYTIFRVNSVLSGKESTVHVKNEVTYFSQRYAKNFDFRYYLAVVREEVSLPIPAPALVSVNLDESQVTWEAFEGQRLSLLRDPNRLHLNAFLNGINYEINKNPSGQEDESEQAAAEHCANLLRAMSIEESSAIWSELTAKRHIRYIHGDLHPDNILVANETWLAVDWDEFKVGFWWFDYLTLLTHPDLAIPKDEKIDILSRYFDFFEAHDVLAIAQGFAAFKVRQLTYYSHTEPRLLRLADRYTRQWLANEIVSSA